MPFPADTNTDARRRHGDPLGRGKLLTLQARVGDAEIHHVRETVVIDNFSALAEEMSRRMLEAMPPGIDPGSYTIRASSEGYYEFVGYGPPGVGRTSFPGAKHDAACLRRRVGVTRFICTCGLTDAQVEEVRSRARARFGRPA